ncbi:pleiotropic regulator 1-like [Convolutriloba macropyga]|uniref:pleiotropic regulator 1-like n=1 Tax=Convolutriloba macropyga TaxID=536237 RepID=UPI003F521728
MASGVNETVQKHTVHTLVFRSLKRTYDMFVSEQGFMPEPDSTLYKSKMSIKARDQYGPILHMPVEDPKSARKQHAPDAVIHPVMGALDPKSGRPASGYTLIRHNDIRDSFANLLNEVCNDVDVEPCLQSLQEETFANRTTTIDDDA